MPPSTHAKVPLSLVALEAVPGAGVAGWGSIWVPSGADKAQMQEGHRLP